MKGSAHDSFPLRSTYLRTMYLLRMMKWIIHSRIYSTIGVAGGVLGAAGPGRHF